MPKTPSVKVTFTMPVHLLRALERAAKRTTIQGIARPLRWSDLVRVTMAREFGKADRTQGGVVAG